ncbi:nucleotidyl transferase AbiEii/AbiGii toxin family protein [Gemmatimonadota bacterium]
MTDPVPSGMKLHLDADFFREAVTFTAAETAFLPRLVEKDYFASILLQYLSSSNTEIVFKGGTCLAKVHFEFYRMSEDLDFSIPTPTDSTLGQRRQAIARVKKVIEDINEKLDDMIVISPMTGANRSTQYSAAIGYQSLLSSEQESLKVEVGLREPLLTSCIEADAQTLLLNPVSRRLLIPGFKVKCLSLLEATAEKIRAALTRRDVAIRDFFDIQYAVHHQRVNLDDSHLQRLIRDKLSMPDNASIDISEDRLRELRLQLDTQLRSVLRSRDYNEFDLEGAFKTVTSIASKVS